MTMVDKLYLRYICKPCEDISVNGDLSFPSAICRFISEVLNESKSGKVSYSVVLVKSPTDHLCDYNIGSSSTHCSHKKNSEFVSIEECPTWVKHVELPVLVTSNGKMIHSGLCSVLRRLVKLAHADCQGAGFNALLGHHEMCLRSCAEVSVWTKFCEVEMPNLVQGLGCQSKSSNEESSKIPEELLRFENHLRQPAVIPQIYKRKQHIYKTLTSKNEIHAEEGAENWINYLNGKSLQEYVLNCDKNSEEYIRILKLLKDNKKLQCNVDIPGLDHAFAEGADFTLTDLVLLPSVTCILNFLRTEIAVLLEAVPHVLRWYQKLTSVKIIQDALENAGLPLVTIGSTTTVPKDASVLSLETRSDSSLVKQKVRVSIAAADVVLATLQTSGVLLEESSYQSIGSGLKWDDFPVAVHPAQGNLPNNRVSRKCEQLENLALAITSLAKPGDVIVDFCAGGGHLGIVVAYLLPQCQVLLIENKEESIRRALERTEQLQLDNVILYQSNLDYFTGRFDIGTCLHACGVATDLVLEKCMQASASFVVCPCCYGGIQNTHTLTYPRSHKYRDLMTYQDHLLLAHAADDEKTGKQFMLAVDMDRVELAKEYGYKTKLCSLQPLSCSPKNSLLIGWKDR